jgi:hypothetical protein
MKRLLALLPIAACASAPAPDRFATCELACDHLDTLAVLDVELTIRRTADHSDAETAAHLRDRAAWAQDLNHDFCYQHCLEPSWDAACVSLAATFDQAKACLTTAP